MPRVLAIGLAACLTIISSLAFAAGAAAQEIDPPTEIATRPLPGRGIVRGEIIDIEENTLILRTPRRELPVAAGADTRVRIIGQPDATISDLETGDIVMVRGRPADGGLRAQAIFRQPSGDHIAGRVATVAEDGFSLRRRQGPVDIAVEPDTVVVRGKQELTWAGDPSGRDLLRYQLPVLAFGEGRDGDADFVAHTVVVLALHRRDPGAAGEIIDLNEADFQLLTRSGKQLLVLTSEDTRFRHPDIQNPTLADFAVGDHVVVLGRENDGEINALLIAPAPARGRPVRGRIGRIDGATIVLSTVSGLEVTILTNADTRYRIGRDREADLSDFAAGDQIVVAGRATDQEAVLTAVLVARRAP